MTDIPCGTEYTMSFRRFDTVVSWGGAVSTGTVPSRLRIRSVYLVLFCTVLIHPWHVRYGTDVPDHHRPVAPPWPPSSGGVRRMTDVWHRSEKLSWR